jgi:predicted nucleic acid-binding Zn ribbon protein
MTRRVAPRPLGEALAAITRDLEPQTPLARVQRAWREVARPPLSEEAEPTSERAGTVTLTCRSSVWAQELSLLAPDLEQRLNEALGAPENDAAVKELRFVVGTRKGTG